MSAVFSLVAVVVLAGIAYFGVQAELELFFGIVVPYIALGVFLLGVVYKILQWAKVPVPFRIPTTCGQQKSLPFIENKPLENPHNTLSVIGRMALEIFLFRSLFRNTKSDLAQEASGPRLVYGSTKWLWLAGLLFHYTFLIIFIRHFKFFVEPVPSFVLALQSLDGFFQIGLPILYLTDVVVVVAVTYLLLRRLWVPQLRYISLASDYFPLLLILGIVGTGMWMRYFGKVDLLGVKELATGLLTFAPRLPAEPIGAMFYVHLFLVSALMIYFPFSKLMHMPGVFMSPTRNMVNNNRAVRHVNPWAAQMRQSFHTYAAYEDEFRPLMKAAGLPLDKDLPEETSDDGGKKGKEE